MSSPVDATGPAAAVLSDTQMRRYARHILLPEVGGVGQLRLLGARVAVDVRDGAHAEIAAIADLAAAGLGTIELAGDPTGAVTARDVGGGILYAAADRGRPRIDAIRDRVTDINLDVRVVVATGDRVPLSVPESHADLADVADALIRGGAAVVRIVSEIV